MVGIFDQQRRRIEDNERKNHLLERNAVHGDAVLRKMRGRIDVGSVLADHLVVRAAKSVLRDGIGLARLRIDGWRHLCLTEARPDRRIGAEAVGQIDELLARDDAICTTERAFGLHWRNQPAGDQSRCDGFQTKSRTYRFQARHLRSLRD